MELSRVKMDSNPSLKRNFEFYKLLAKCNMGDSFSWTDEQLIDNYAKL